MTGRWLIVADDVTGALDSAAGFVGGGLVEYGDAASPDAAVVAISTGGRAAPDGVPGIGADRDRFDRVFVKIDSTVRGRPRDHVDAVLGWWHRGATAVVCPAAPRLGRTVRQGRVLVEGLPATRSAAGDDPVAPTRSDRLPELFEAPLVEVGGLADAIGRLPVVVVDASADEDLDAIAAVLDAAGPLAVPVGSAGLAAALGRGGAPEAVERPRAARVVVLATSVHPVAQGQLAVLRDRGSVVVPPPLLVGSVAHEHAAVVARAAAEVAAERLEADPAAAVVVVGGDGTDALLSALGASGVEVRGAVEPGVPWGRIRGGRAGGTTIVTKSGGFGDPDTLDRLIRSITEDPTP